METVKTAYPTTNQAMQHQHKWMERSNGCWLLMNAVEHLQAGCKGSEVADALSTLPNNRVFRTSTWDVMTDYVQATSHKKRWFIKLCLSCGLPSPAPWWTQTVWPIRPYDVFNAMRERCIIKSKAVE